MAPRYAEHEKRMKEARTTKTGYFKAKSRKKFRMARRAPVSDSKRTYRGTMQATPLSQYCAITKGDCYCPPSITRIGKTVKERDTEANVGHLADLVDLVDLTEDKETCVLSESSPQTAKPDVIYLDGTCESDDDQHSQGSGGPQFSPAVQHDRDNNILVESPTPDIICLLDSSDEEQVETAISYIPVAWPDDVIQIDHTENPDDLIVPDLGPVDWCGCKNVCEPESCPNALSSIFCAPNNCRNGVHCGNRLQQLDCLQLAEGSIGYFVFTTQWISEGTIVAEYAGVLTAHDYSLDQDRVSDYTIALEVRSSRKEKLWIEARDRGSISRFMNHSCSANCAFFEVQNRRFVTVVVVAIEDIAPDKEVTVDYGDELWFTCKCEAEKCRGTRKTSD